MMGFIYICVMAACVVLFLPMAMAGYHLSRNKMLFFSGALFITLAVGVHLTPYFPSVSQFITEAPKSSTSPLAPGISCLSFVNHVRWQDCAPAPSDGSRVVSLRTWDWAGSDPAFSCGFQKFREKRDVLDLLNGSWVLVAGDSQARLFVVALLGLALDEERLIAAEKDLFKRHSNYQILVEENGMMVDYLWAPYPENLTAAVVAMQPESRRPDVLVMGSALWHMLHVGSPTDYGNSLLSLKSSLVRNKLGVNTRAYWLGMPTLVNSMLNTQEKQEKMKASTLEAYSQEVNRSKILYRSGGPLMLLDVEQLSRNCGLECTSDGMHYDGVVYEAALQIMLNALLIESRQRIS